jgi:hypothetical protein
MSPCHSVWEHMRSLGASRFNVVRLAKRDYHIRMDGIEQLTDNISQDCGYSCIKASVENVVMCYNDIIMVHHKICKLWYDTYMHTSGPQVDKILHKLPLVFPWLESLRGEDVVNFYDHL